MTDKKISGLTDEELVQKDNELNDTAGNLMDDICEIEEELKEIHKEMRVRNLKSEWSDD
jgi:hypothetical protein